MNSDKSFTKIVSLYVGSSNDVKHNLAEGIGVSYHTVSNWIKGKTKPHPRIEKIVVAWINENPRITLQEAKSRLLKCVRERVGSEVYWMRNGLEEASGYFVGDMCYMQVRVSTGARVYYNTFDGKDAEKLQYIGTEK